MPANGNDPIRLVLNGERVDVAGVSPQATLLSWLRETRQLPGTKEGCAVGDYGACTVVVAESRGDGTLAFHFCRHCGCVTHWRGLRARADGRTRIAVNLRMAEPDAVAHIPIQRFDGLLTWEDLPRDGRCIADVWY